MRKNLTIKELRHAIRKSQHEDIEDLLVNLYKNNTNASRQIEIFFQARSLDAELMEAKKRIYKAFHPKNLVQVPNLTKIKSNISNFKKFKPSAYQITELQLTYITNLAEFLDSYDGPDSFYNSLLSVTSTLVYDRKRANIAFDKQEINSVNAIINMLKNFGWYPDDSVLQELDYLS